MVKYCSDITAQKLANADYEGQIAAIGKSQAVAEFEMDGTLIQANSLFLNTMGYSSDEVVGKHHRQFVSESTAASPSYVNFWKRLNRGEFVGGEFQRVGKGGKDVWIQATYTPILDPSGKPCKLFNFLGFFVF